MHAFEILSDPVRRRLLELLADGECSSGSLAEVIRDEFGISQPAVSQHLRMLREHGYATVRPDGTRRLYAVDANQLHEVDEWLASFRHFWAPRNGIREPSTSRAHATRGRPVSDKGGA